MLRRQDWTRLLIAAFLFVFVVPMCALAQDAQDVQVTPPPSRRIEPPPANANPADLEERGDQLRSEKAYLDAIDYYEAALKKLPKGNAKAVVYNKVGMAQLMMGRVDDAKKNYEKAVKMDKTFPYAVNNLAYTHYTKKKYGKAIKLYKKAIELNPNVASFHSNLGAAYFAKKEIEKAVPEYQIALSLDPDVLERRSATGQLTHIASPEDRARYSYVLAKMYAQNGMFDRSLLYLRRAIEEGYKEVDNAYKDTEFTELRKDPRFTALMEQKPSAIE
ncbi:MAG TPA: tetratricopeptide repeat protein [Terriglobales bacterium]|nr:tetratricopeptide repeat protein [Terriglobales bacterium]